MAFKCILLHKDVRDMKKNKCAMYDTQWEAKKNLLKRILVERKISDNLYSRGIFPIIILFIYK